MKTSRLILLAALLTGSTAFLTAGPGPQFWNRPVAPKAPAVVAPAKAPAPAPVTCATCSCCKKN